MEPKDDKGGVEEGKEPEATGATQESESAELAEEDLKKVAGAR